MQVQPKKRWHNNRAQWVVDTRPEGIRKVQGQKGGEKFFDTQLEAEEYAAQVNDLQKKSGSITPTEAGFLSDLVGKFKDLRDNQILQGQVSFSYGDSQKKALNHLSTIKMNDGQFFGELKCLDITIADIRYLVEKGLTKNRKDKTKILTLKTKKSYLNALKLALDLAIELGWASENVARSYRFRANKYNYSIEEVEAKNKKFDKIDPNLLKILINNVLKLDKPTFNSRNEQILPAWCDGLAIIFAAFTGLRFGEQSALKWKFVDFKSKEILVVAAHRRVAKKIIRAGFPKNSRKSMKGQDIASRRTIPMGPLLLQELQKWKVRSPRSDDEDLVFITRNETLQVSSDNWRNRFKAVYRKIEGFPHTRWHDLRHIYASIIIDQMNAQNTLSGRGNMSWHEIKTLMGHQKIETTLDHYHHWIKNPEKDQARAKAIESKYFPNATL